LGACATVSRGSLRWIGVRAIPESLAEAYAQLEVTACSHGLRATFSAGPSPTLGGLATKFACLFFFLGTNVLSIRTVAKLIHDGSSDARSLERRLYLAVSFLESAMVIEHTPKPSEYRIVIDRAVIVDSGMAARKSHLRDACPCQFESLLSRYDERYLAALHGDRQVELAGILSK
jgi:hypothetical protein